MAWLSPPFQTATDLQRDAALLRARAYGVIEMVDDNFRAVHLRPWPKIASLVETWWDNRWRHRRATGNHCWLYYNQPSRCRNYLALSYVRSTKDTTLATFHGALVVLDEIARLKQTDAIVCEVTNLRISDRLLKRWGWEQHCLDRRGRHFIKRFYGEYPRRGSIGH